MKPVAIQYTCRNPGQTALLWAWQPAPFGHGWIDVKAEPLVRLSDVEALRAELDVYRQLFSSECKVTVDPDRNHVWVDVTRDGNSRTFQFCHDGSPEHLAHSLGVLLK